MDPIVTEQQINDLLDLTDLPSDLVTIEHGLAGCVINGDIDAIKGTLPPYFRNPLTRAIVQAAHRIHAAGTRPDPQLVLAEITTNGLRPFRDYGHAAVTIAACVGAQAVNPAAYRQALHRQYIRHEAIDRATELATAAKDGNHENLLDEITDVAKSLAWLANHANKAAQ